MGNQYLTLGAISGGLAVMIGAFGAHALKDVLIENGTLETFKTASTYHLTHSIFLCFIGYLLASNRDKLLKWICQSLVAGMFFFSGSLYILAITGIKKMGAVAPIGGIFLIMAWSIMAVYAIRRN